MIGRSITELLANLTVGVALGQQADRLDALGHSPGCCGLRLVELV